LDPNSSENLLVIGKVVKAHGLKGLLKVFSYAQSEETFHNSDTVFLRKEEWERVREFKILSVIDQKNTVLLALEGISSIETAERLRGSEVLIEKGSLVRADDEYFWHELIGLKVFLNTGVYLGDVSSIISEKGNDIYVVRNGDKELPIPATHEVVRKIDLETGTMTVRPLEGMFDLNEV
jgi:16S rRNA processing protein RimM